MENAGVVPSIWRQVVLNGEEEGQGLVRRDFLCARGSSRLCVAAQPRSGEREGERRRRRRREDGWLQGRGVCCGADAQEREREREREGGREGEGERNALLMRKRSGAGQAGAEERKRLKWGE